MRDITVGGQCVGHFQNRYGALRREAVRLGRFDAERGTTARDGVPEKVVRVKPFSGEGEKEGSRAGTPGVGDDS